MQNPLQWFRQGGARGMQLKTGLACGLVAMVLYSARPPQLVETPEVAVLALSRPVALGTRISETMLASSSVPEVVAADYLLDTPENRTSVIRRGAHMALAKGTRLARSMFIGGLDNNISADIPADHRSQGIDVKSVAAGVGRGTRVDVLGPRGPLLEDVLVLDTKPFTVAVPNDSTLDLIGLKNLTVAARPDVDPGRVTPKAAPPPRRVAKASDKKAIPPTR